MIKLYLVGYILGVGSFNYLAYSLNHVEMAGGDRLWAIVGLVILLSILLHGFTVTPAMRFLDRSQGRDPDTINMPLPEPEDRPPARGRLRSP